MSDRCLSPTTNLPRHTWSFSNHHRSNYPGCENEGYERGTLEGPWNIRRQQRSADNIQNQIPACEEAGRLSGIVQSASSSFLENCLVPFTVSFTAIHSRVLLFAVPCRPIPYSRPRSCSMMLEFHVGHIKGLMSPLLREIILHLNLKYLAQINSHISIIS